MTTELFLAETHAFILKRADRRAADQTLRSVLSSPRFDVVFGNEQAYRAAMELLASRPDIRLSYADAHGLACARERGIDTAFTLDRAWAAFGFTILD